MQGQVALEHGSPLMVDHTPGGAVTAGDVIVIGEGVRIAHSSIAANIKGALAAGFAVYRCAKASGGGTAIADLKPVFWDDTNNRIHPNSAAGANKFFGVTIGASVDGDTEQLVLHLPAAMAGMFVAGGSSGPMRIAFGEVTLDGSNPTSVAAAATGLATIVAATASLKTAVAPGDDPSWLTVDYGGAVPAGRLDIHAWKNTGGTDPTLVASTNNTAVISWVAVGT